DRFRGRHGRAVGPLLVPRGQALRAGPRPPGAGRAVQSPAPDRGGLRRTGGVERPGAQAGLTPPEGSAPACPPGVGGPDPPGGRGRGSRPPQVPRILWGMAKSEGGKADKKAARAAKRQAGKEQRGQMWQALKIQTKQDKLLWPLMIGAVVLSAVVFFLLGMLWGGQWWMLPLGVLTGVMAAMIIFSRRVQKTVFAKAEGQPGAAAWALDQLRSGWRVNQAVAATTNFDAVHRVVGRCGIVLVGEGQPHRLKPLLTQEKKKVSRVVGDTPIYELIVGDEEGASPEQVP